MTDVTITLRGKAAKKLRELVRAQNFARPEDAIEAALDALSAGADPELDAWLSETIVARAEALAADPARALTADQVRDRLNKR